MMRVPLRLLTLIAAIPCGTAPLTAQVKDTWERVQSLTPGTKLQVYGAGSNQRWQGAFTSASAGGITLASPGNAQPAVVTIRRDECRQIRARTGWSPGKRALAGVAVGAALMALPAGTVLGLGGRDSPKLAAAIVLSGAALGAGIGAALPLSWRTVYRTK